MADATFDRSDLWRLARGDVFSPDDAGLACQHARCSVDHLAFILATRDDPRASDEVAASQSCAGLSAPVALAAL